MRESRQEGSAGCRAPFETLVGQSFSHLFVIGSASPDLLALIKKRYRESAVLFWDIGTTPLSALQDLSEESTILILQDDLAASLEEVDHPVKQRLSRFDSDLFTRIARSSSSGEERESTRDRSEELRSQRGRIILCPSNDTHVKMFATVQRHLKDSRILLFDERPAEKAEFACRELGLDFSWGGPEALADLEASVAVFACDWYVKVHEFLTEARKKGIPTAILQEGCLDFNTRHRRMESCDIPLIQGPVMPRYLDRPSYMITGNPRFDELGVEPLPKSPRVMINCNFTYSIHEADRDPWVAAAVRSCQSLGVEFFISQHPRDPGQFPNWPTRRSNAMRIRDQIKDCNVLISRFSTVIYEAMLLGRQVVHFNPHGETMQLFNGDLTGGIHQARTPDELEITLGQAMSPVSENQWRKFHKFLDLHCGPRDGKASFRCASALVHISDRMYPRPRRGILRFLSR